MNDNKEKEPGVSTVHQERVEKLMDIARGFHQMVLPDEDFDEVQVRKAIVTILAVYSGVLPFIVEDVKTILQSQTKGEANDKA